NHNQEPRKVAQTYLKFKLAESPEIGQDIKLILLACNLTFEYKNVKLSVSTQSMLHNSTPHLPSGRTHCTSLSIPKK
ncbi:unnamed protein product, partial [Lepidochelys kempii]